jgi:hypothetical protein
MADLHSPADPLMRNVALPHTVRLPVLGIPVRFATNSPAALDAVTECFGMWEHLNRYPDLLETGDAAVRIVEHEGQEGMPARSPMQYRSPDGERLVVHTPGSLGIVDARRRDAVAYVTSELLTDRGHFQYGMLEAMTLLLVEFYDRLPLHAALVVRNGVAILLAGQSGLGKSTLAYQARRAGWTLLADDGVHVQTAPVGRLWGIPRRLYLSPDASRWFPELAHQQAQLLPNGKTKIAMLHAHDWEGFGPPVVERAAICVLARSAGAATIERMDADAVGASLLTDLLAAHDLHRDAARQVIPRLAAGGGWRLALSPSPADAAPLLDALAEQIGRT